MGEIDISEMKVKELRTLKGAYEEIGITKGRLSQLIAKDRIDYGTIDGVKLIPKSEIERRKREPAKPGNPNFGPGYSRWDK